MITNQNTVWNVTNNFLNVDKYLIFKYKKV